MIHRLYTFCVFLYLSTLQWHINNCEKARIQSETRITKASNCNITGLKWNIQNISILRSSLNIDLNITEETKNMKKVISHLDRCISQDSDCEDFQTWNFDNFCSMMNWKNQMWNVLFDAFHPRFRCPIKKALYRGRNITYDANAVSKWYPDYAKYFWKTKTTIFNERDELVCCILLESHVYQFRKRNRKS